MRSGKGEEASGAVLETKKQQQQQQQQRVRGGACRAKEGSSGCVVCMPQSGIARDVSACREVMLERRQWLTRNTALRPVTNLT